MLLIGPFTRSMVFLLVILIVVFARSCATSPPIQQNVTYNVQNDVAEMIAKLSKKIDSFSEYCSTLPATTCGPCRCKDDDRLVQKFYCDCQNLQPKRDCLEFHIHGYRVNGIYKVHQNHIKTIQVYCDQLEDYGGWTVLQRRQDGSTNFYRPWQEYKAGFGQLQHEFWVGNDNLFTLTLQGLYPKGSELRIDLEDWKGVKKFAKYNDFQVGNENTKYEMHVKGFTGNVGNDFEQHSGCMFTTYDRDNDRHPTNCAADFKGAWWYNSCHPVCLNGRYYYFADKVPWATGIHWGSFHAAATSYTYSLKFTEMKIRRKL